MTPESWWKRRSGCAKALMAGSFANGIGSMQGVEPRLAAALGDILSRPGSLVRAVTAYLVGIEMGVAEEAARAVACGIEYLHTASLVFDDLPAMDDARTRRGAPCPHVVHGEAVAMLAALAIINRGYAMIWQGIRSASPARRERAGDWVDARLGPRGVIGGQAFDLRGWRGEQSAAEVSEVAARKTGDLLRLTLVLPAIIGRGTDREIQLLDRIGMLRGLAYQAADDLKDVLCPEDESGKTGGRDAELGRPNLILAEGFQATLRRFKRLRQTGDRLQAKLPGGDVRWGMLAPLRVTLPTTPQMVMVPAAVLDIPTHPMSLWRMVFTNLRRHRVRTAIGAAGIALGVATMLSVVGLLGGAVKMFERILQSDSEVVVFEKNVSDLFFSNVPVEVAEELEKQPFVKDARPVLFTIITAPGRPVVTCFGITPDDPRLTKGEWLQGSAADFNEDANGVVLGERAADFLNAKAGGTIELGQGTYPVAGVLRMENGFENGGVFMPLGTCQREFHKEGLCSVITVALADGHGSAEVKDWMGKTHKRLTALENEEFSRSYSQFKIMKTTAWVVGGCAFLLGGLSVTNTMILSVFGRIRELAIARVCGFSRGQIARMIFGESLLVSAIGTALGWALSIGGLHALRAVPQLQGYIDPRIGWMEVAGALSLAVITALAGALYPAWYAANLKPAEALRFE